MILCAPCTSHSTHRWHIAKLYNYCNYSCNYTYKPTWSRPITSNTLAKANHTDLSQRKIFRKTFPKSRPTALGLFLFFAQWLPAAASVAVESWCSRRRICRMMEWNASSTKWHRAADVSKNGQSHWLANATPSSLFTCSHMQQVSTISSQSINQPNCICI